jgi:hypothetical protein
MISAEEEGSAILGIHSSPSDKDEHRFAEENCVHAQQIHPHAKKNGMVMPN